MADKKAEAALDQWHGHEEEHRLWRPHWQELADYIQPRKNNIFIYRSPGRQQTERMFDSTAPHANELLAASMQGALTSSAFQWFQYRLKGVELARDHQVSLLLEQCSKDSNDAINESNFASESHELYLDTPCFGIGALFVDEKRPKLNEMGGQLRFTALPPGSFVIDEDEDGYVDKVFRSFKLSARASAAAFGDDVVGKNVQAALKKTPSQKFEFMQVVWPRTDSSKIQKRLPATKKPYGTLWIGVEDKNTVRESGYDEPPILAPRWSKTSGETYGRGPGSIALADIKTLNKAVELKLKAWAKMVDPPVAVRHEGVIGQVKLMNGGVTYVRDQEAIKILALGGDMQVADMEEEKLRQAVRRMFFSDQLQLQEGPQMTAYEVQVRYELMQRILGPTLGRLTVEFLNPLIERIFWIRLRASAKNSPYRQLQKWAEVNGVALDIEYEGPLAKAQRLQESVAMQRFFQIALPLAQAKPDVMDNVDLDMVLRLHAQSVGVPESIMVPASKVQSIRQARIQAQEQQAALDAVSQGAKAGGDVAPLVAALGKQQEGTIPAGVGSPAVGSG